MWLIMGLCGSSNYNARFQTDQYPINEPNPRQEPLANHIGDYLHNGLVEYAYFVGMRRYKDLFRTTSQWWAYNDCALRFATRHRWAPRGWFGLSDSYWAVLTNGIGWSQVCPSLTGC